MSTYTNGAKGLKLMYIAGIISIISSIVSGTSYFVSEAYIVSSSLTILATILSLFGIIKLSKDSADVKTAIYFGITAFAISILFFVLNLSDFYKDVMGLETLAMSIVDLIILYYVIKGIRTLCAKVEANDVAKYAKRTWNVNIVSLVIIFISTFVLVLIPLSMIFGKLTGASDGAILASKTAWIVSALALPIAAVMQIAASIMFIVLLGKASKALSSN